MRQLRVPLVGLLVLTVAILQPAASVLTSAQETSPVAASSDPLPSLLEPRAEHTATLLPDGRILVTGGVGPLRSSAERYLASAELYDPATGTSSPAGTMAEPRNGHTATLLPGGRVLVVGGGVRTAELWDPETLSFLPAGDLPFAVLGNTSTLLPDGRVLVVGGEIAALSNVVLEDAQLWDPVTRTFIEDGRLRREHWDHTATLLPDGRVLVVGGGTALAASELWDPLAGSFGRAPRLSTGRYGHTATLLLDGGILVVGGISAAYAPNSIIQWLERSAELRDPGTGRFGPAGRLAQGRNGHTATRLADGRVVILGGSGKDGLLASAELWDPGRERFTSGTPLTQGRSHHTATLLPDGRIVVLGGIAKEPGRRLVLASGEWWVPPPAETPASAVPGQPSPSPLEQPDAS